MEQVLRRMREEEGGIEANPKRDHMRGNETMKVPAQPRKSAKAGRNTASYPGCQGAVLWDTSCGFRCQNRCDC
jgi:hypothetical protein